LGDKKTAQYGGWTSNTVGVSISGFLAVNQPDAFPTEIDEVSGQKQAFLMSGSDVSNGQGTYGGLTPETLKHRDVLKANGISISWLRSPGYHPKNAAYLRSVSTAISTHNVTSMNSVVPSLVVHVP